MRKLCSCFLFVISTVFVQAQIGINTSLPKATLHVKQGIQELADGIIAPIVSGDQLLAKSRLYTQEQLGAIVFVDAITSKEQQDQGSSVYYIQAPGYHYFDGKQWKPFERIGWNLRGNQLNGHVFAQANIVVDGVSVKVEGKFQSGDFIGTTNNQALVLKANDKSIGYLHQGVISFGVDAFANQLTTNQLNVIALGSNALMSNEKADNNIALGQKTLVYTKSGDDNIAIGAFGLNKLSLEEQSIQNANNIAIGSKAASSLLQGNNNAVVGDRAMLYVSQGQKNVAIGAHALYGNAKLDHQTGDDNTAVGYGALYQPFAKSQGGSNIDLGNGNTALGSFAGINVVGNRNIFIGHQVTMSHTVDQPTHAVTDINEISNTMNIANVVFAKNILQNNETYRNSIAHVGIGEYAPQARLDISGYTQDATGDKIRFTDPLRLQGLGVPSSQDSVKLLVVNQHGVVKTQQLSDVIKNNNEFFYMPSLLLPTSNLDARIIDSTNENYSFSQDIFTVNLYTIFKDQFERPVASSSGGTLGDLVLGSDQYEYFVTYAQEQVFTQINVSKEGVLSYKIVKDVILNSGSFMNIVLKVK